jgi:hypothetical protein
VAGAGLALLCVSMLLPRIKIDDPDGEMAVYSFSMFSGVGTGFGMDTPTVVLSIALLAAVGMSAHRSPALRWPSRLGAIGTAALLAAFAYHPVTVMRQTLEAYADDDGYTDEDSISTSAEDIDITADSGVYLVLLAAILLALSCFLMQTNPRKNQAFLSYQEMQPPPGTNPTVTSGRGPAAFACSPEASRSVSEAVPDTTYRDPSRRLVRPLRPEGRLSRPLRLRD